MDETKQRSAKAGSVFGVLAWFLDHPRVGTLVWSAGCAAWLRIGAWHASFEYR